MHGNRLLILSLLESTCQELTDYFHESNYSVIWTNDYEEAVEIISKGRHNPNLMIFDMEKPESREYDIMRYAREVSNMGIIILSSDGRLDSQLYAYSTGIDDYMVKPVPLPLIEAHAEAVLRRQGEKNISLDVIGELSVDYEARRVYLANHILNLTAKEFDLLVYFIQHKGMILSRDKILDAVWGYDYVGGDRSVDTIIKKLRAKLTSRYPYIKTIYGVGYCFEV